MSNLRSISEGSFVLGDTNGLTFEAGSGIKISEPSEGTVRIANDETVLWSGTLGWGGNASLSDSVKNYERIRFFVEDSNRHRKSVNELVLTDLSTEALREFALNFLDATPTYFGNYFTVFQINEAGTTISSVSGRQWWYNPWTNTTISGSSDRGLFLKKVVGLNRISGGN